MLFLQINITKNDLGQTINKYYHKIPRCHVPVSLINIMKYRQTNAALSTTNKICIAECHYILSPYERVNVSMWVIWIMHALQKAKLWWHRTFFTPVHFNSRLKWAMCIVLIFFLYTISSQTQNVEVNRTAYIKYRIINLTL